MATAPPPLPNPRRRIWIALCLAVPCLLAALFAVLSIPAYNWRSERAFHNHVAELKALGETLRIEDLKPEEPSNADRTFAGHPFIRQLMEEARSGETDLPASDTRVERLSVEAIPGLDPDSTRRRGNRYAGGRGLPAFAPPLGEAEAAQAILAYGETVAEDLHAFAEAARRPESHFSLPYEAGYEMGLSELNPFEVVADFVDLRAKASLIAGDSASAANDAVTLLRLSEQFREEPSLIAQLIRVLIRDRAVGVVHEGLRRSAWTEDQLGRIAAELPPPDFGAAFADAMRMERAQFVHLMNTLIDDPELIFEFLPESERPPPLAIPFLSIFTSSTRGWILDNSRLYSEIAQSEVIGFAASGSDYAPLLEGSIDRELLRESSSALGRTRYVFVKAALPVFQGVAHRFARSAVHSDHARIALAIEAHRLSTGRPPDSLDALGGASPVLNLLDPFTDELYGYQLLDDGTYLLYSVGLNLSDDGGATGRGLNAGDWVWRLALPDAQ